MLFEATHT